jgi:adenylate cyclase
MTQSAERANARDVTERVAPRGVAKAIRFMQRNVTRQLTLGEIAAAAGMPERTLRRQFQRFIGRSPIAFHRYLRLEAVHQALCDDRRGTDVTAAAGEHGFGHLSYFTAQYQRRYGELPSATLRAHCARPIQPYAHAHDSVNLAIMPFRCSQAEFAEAALAEATTDRVIAALTCIPWLNVLSPEGNFPPDDRAPLASRRARFAVRGEVRSIGKRLQVAIRLFDATTSCHIWGNTFEGVPERAAELQERVAQGVAGYLPAYLHDIAVTRVKRTTGRDPAAVRHVMQAFDATFEITRSASDRALESLDRAQSLDPEFPLAKAVAAWCHALRATCFFGDAANADRDKARHLISLALSMDNQDPLVLAALGNASAICGDLDLGETLVEKCLAIDPYCMMGWQRRGWIAVYRGSSSNALADFRRALRLNPSRSQRFNTILGISWAHVLAGNHDQAVDWAMKGLRERPTETWACRIAAVAQVRRQQMNEARRNAALLLRQYPDMTVDRIITALPMRPEHRELMGDGLQAAGLPLQ